MSLGRVSEDLRFLGLKFSSRFPKDVVSKDMGISLIESSSPSSSVSWVTLFHTPLALARAGLGQVFLDYMDAMNYQKSMEIFNVSLRHFKIFDATLPKVKNILLGRIGLDLKDGASYIGMLKEKLEPAGKVRVFAMVDVWTQSLLRPLHLALFQFLKSLPNDGTFDQTSS